MEKLIPVTVKSLRLGASACKVAIIYSNCVRLAVSICYAVITGRDAVLRVDDTRDRRYHILRVLRSTEESVDHAYIVLPPSQNSCPTSSLNRENSGIAPKRHTIRYLLNEHYSSMNMM